MIGNVLEPARRRVLERTPAHRSVERERDAAARARLRTLVETLDGHAPAGADLDTLLERAASALAADVHAIWLALAVISAELPLTPDVVAARRRAELDGPGVVLAQAVRDMRTDTLDRRVEVASGEVVVDVNHLARTTLTTGIQRVTLQTVSRWHRDHDPSFVVWTDQHRTLRRLTAAEVGRMLDPSPSTPPEPEPSRCLDVVIPWRSRYVLPEVALEVPRTKRMQALILYARCATAVTGFDAVPLTTAETTEVDVPSHFMHELSAVRHVDRIATISSAASTEYEGWRTMISASGLAGPQIHAIPLAFEAPEPSAEDLAAARSRYCLPTVPLVLCVGSHEPRKNHLAVLAAAEVLWRRGREFSLLFVGGNAWSSGRFERRLASLVAAGRPVESVRAVPDGTLWALYRLARCSVFPSLNEGFGLPLAESLASGTPAVTSDFGSMREIGAGRGALLVDPRDDRSIADGLDRLLTDDDLHAHLTRAAAAREPRSWDDYAAETWEYMVATNAVRSEGS